MQQTGAARDLALSLIQNGSGVVSALASPLSMVGTAATYMQNREILQGIQSMQLLQMGGLAMTGLGIGISLAGFAITQAQLHDVTKRLDEVKNHLSRISARIEDLFDEKIRDDLLALEAVCDQVDDAWLLADPVPAWSATVGPLNQLEVQFFNRAERSLSGRGPYALDAAQRFIDAALLASATLVSVRTACGELDAARRAADRSSEELQKLTTGIGLRDVLDAALGREGQLSVAGRVDAMERLKPQSLAQIAGLRLREEQAASSGIALQRLASGGVDGRAYLERMRSEKAATFALVLPEPELTNA